MFEAIQLGFERFRKVERFIRVTLKTLTKAQLNSRCRESKSLCHAPGAARGLFPRSHYKESAQKPPICTNATNHSWHVPTGSSEFT